jgi:hypothetical protein
MRRESGTAGAGSSNPLVLFMMERPLMTVPCSPVNSGARNAAYQLLNGGQMDIFELR